MAFASLELLLHTFPLLLEEVMELRKCKSSKALIMWGASCQSLA